METVRIWRFSPTEIALICTPLGVSFRKNAMSPATCGLTEVVLATRPAKGRATVRGERNGSPCKRKIPYSFTRKVRSLHEKAEAKAPA